MAFSRRGFIKGLSAAMAAMMPLRCVDVQSKEFNATEPFQPPEEPQKDIDWNTPLTEVRFDEQEGVWKHGEDIPSNVFVGSGESIRDHKYDTTCCSGIMQKFEYITQEEMGRRLSKMNRRPACSG